MLSQAASDSVKPRISAIERYVDTPDDSYEWKVVKETPGKGYTAYVLRLVSQTWLTEAEVVNPVWWHWLTVVVPDEVQHDKAFLYVSGGSNRGGDGNERTDPPGSISPLLTMPATATGSITAELNMVPNQRMTFKGDDYGPRTEDELIAYTWRQYLESADKNGRGGDTKWLARLPMTKAGVRAMDAVTEFAATDQGKETKLSGFVVAGGSKRGWTTWTIALADERVVAIAPIVIDLLNVEPSFQHHWQAYGFWAPAVGDYVREGIMEWQGHPAYAALLDEVDPFEYRDRLTLPKYIMNATGDQFFLPDSWKFYWDELQGTKLLRYVPNAEHSMGGTDVPGTFQAFYQAILEETPLPNPTWSVKGNRIEIQTEAKQIPREIKMWQASNEKTRDFRVDTVGRSWKPTQVQLRDDGHYVFELEAPATGWTATIVELTYDGYGRFPLKVTTGTQVLPEALPHPAFVAGKGGN